MCVCVTDPIIVFGMVTLLRVENFGHIAGATKVCWRSVNNQARGYVCNGVERKRYLTEMVGCHANSFPQENLPSEV